MIGKKLPHYFECHSIIVVASTLVSSILNHPDAMGRVSLWGRPTNRVQRKRGREVFHAEHAPPASLEYLNWSEHPIGFDRLDHPPNIPRPGHHALVLEAQIGGFTSKKVFMDGGSSLNLIYADTLRKIKIPMNDLLPTETCFHGIVPGKPTYPLGVVHLDVIFGTPANFRK
jgi:hypothetical protein